MTGLFHNKYHIAIYDEDQTVIARIAGMLKSWFRNKMVIESYTDPHQMLVDVNIAKAKNKPFDMTVIGGGDEGATYILQKTNPSMRVVTYTDEKTLKKETVKLTFKPICNSRSL